MRAFVNLAIVATLAVSAASAAQAQTTNYNTDPAATWFFGHDNDYSPAHTAVQTTAGGNTLYLRGHETYQGAPTPSGSGVYSLALGTANVSFDFGLGNGNTVNNLSGFDGVTAMITLTHLGTGQTATFDALHWPSDNEFMDGNVQNSARVGWFPVGFDPTQDATYKITLDVAGLDGVGSHNSLSIYDKIGAGSGAVPEPASWAMMLGGFGLVGGAMRRRKAVVSFA